MASEGEKESAGVVREKPAKASSRLRLVHKEATPAIRSRGCSDASRWPTVYAGAAGVAQQPF